MRSLGTGRYQPEVSAFFPRLGRGHSKHNCLACKTGDAKNHDGAKKNRQDWEESVGIKRASRTTRHASHGLKAASQIAIDPKALAAAAPEIAA